MIRSMTPAKGCTGGEKFVREVSGRRLPSGQSRSACQNQNFDSRKIVDKTPLRSATRAGSDRCLPHYREKDSGWFHHVVVVYNGRVHDAWTGRGGDFGF